MSKGALSSESRLKAARVGFSFFVSLLVVGVLDLLISVWSLDPAVEGQGEILRYAPLILLAFPGLGGLLATAAVITRHAFPQEGSGRIPGYGFVICVACSVFWLAIPELFSGQWISSKWWRFIPMLAAMAGAALFIWVLIRFASVGLFARGFFKSSKVQSLIALVIGAGGYLFCRSVLDAMFGGLYESFHLLVSLTALAMVVAMVHRLMVLGGKQPSFRVGLVLFTVAAVFGGGVGHMAAREAPLGRQVVMTQGFVSKWGVKESFHLAQKLQGLFDEPSFARTEGETTYFSARFEEEKKSVVLVSVDALRGDVMDPAGRFIEQAGNIRALAERGRVFERAYSPGNATMVSVPAMVLGYFQRPEGDPPDAALQLAAAFNRGGYSTEFHFTADEYANLDGTAIGPMARRGFQFEKYFKQYRGAEDVLKDVKASLEGGGDPLFVWAHLSDVHTPFLLRKVDVRGAGSKPADYSGQLSHLDEVLGEFFDWMSDRPDLVWAFTSDHGEALGEHGIRYHGSRLFEEQVRVPLVIGGAGVEPGRCRLAVANMRLGATLLTLAGATGMEGEALPVKAGCGEERPVLILGKESCALVSKELKLIVEGGEGTVALYDLARDPGESTNLVSSFKDETKRLAEEMLRLGCPHLSQGILSQVGL